MKGNSMILFTIKIHISYTLYFKAQWVLLTNTRAAVAQALEWLSANRKVAGSIPGLSLAKCP